MKYLKTLTSESDYNEYRYGNDFSRPNVTLCEDNKALKYKDATYDLTITYAYLNSETASPTVVKHYLPNENYRIVSPTINGFTPSQPIIEGIMPEQDVTRNVIYTPAGGGEIPID